MRFQSKTEEEIQKDGLLPDGIYSYQVIESEDKISQKGNEYTAIKLKVWDNEGGEHIVFTNMALIKLLKHFCDVNEMQQQYESDDIPAHNFLYKSGGKVIIEIEPEKKDQTTGKTYKAKNIVKDYIVSPKGSLTAPLSNHTDVNVPFDDQLPF